MATIKYTQLTAPGSTTALKVSGNMYHTFQYKVADKDTNVIVNFQASLDGTTFFDLGTNVTQTANGTYGASFTGVYEEIRFTWVSETGGTAATIDVIIKTEN